jgi:UDP-N-acetylmuramoylalanine-D-glutamate ligase
MAMIAEERFPRHPEDEFGNYLYNITIITGGATGADRSAADWAALEFTDYEEYPANWKKHGKAAGPIRNKQMLDSGVDLVIAFPGGAGTANMVKQAKKAGVKIIQIK